MSSPEEQGSWVVTNIKFLRITKLNQLWILLKIWTPAPLLDSCSIHPEIQECRRICICFVKYLAAYFCLLFFYIKPEIRNTYFTFANIRNNNTSIFIGVYSRCSNGIDLYDGFHKCPPHNFFFNSSPNSFKWLCR